MSHDSGAFIRRSTRLDADNIIDSINAICTEGSAFYITKFTPTVQWNAVLYRPESVPDHLLVVAEWNGQLAGVGNLFPGGEYTVFRHVAELGLWVPKSFRQGGIGGQLLGWMLDWATQTGLEKITLTVFASNQVAVSLYQGFGFVKEGLRQRQFKIGDMYVDELLMARFMSPTMMAASINGATAK